MRKLGECNNWVNDSWVKDRWVTMTISRGSSLFTRDLLPRRAPAFLDIDISPFRLSRITKKTKELHLPSPNTLEKSADRAQFASGKPLANKKNVDK
uniref:Uncharacterized protein n=1 Tax=Romanomermis culicivorax TaxID=13658 RepID=A0A915K3N3_ROMCU